MSKFEKKPTESEIRQILAGVRHSQTADEMDRLHGKIERKLHEFEEIMIQKSEPIDLFMD